MGVTRGRKGGKGGKAVKRATHKANGKYAKQIVRTIANRKRRQAKHLKRHTNKIRGMEKLTPHLLQ